ncbi:hypothetical protein [Phyllobacterium ifriqiyense]|uniref:hypothetical protein n=1 Tax=Phyllobacterium ifriqiyense TaxID=314238 RepID=UPI00339A0AE6
MFKSLALDRVLYGVVLCTSLFFALRMILAPPDALRGVLNKQPWRSQSAQCNGKCPEYMFGTNRWHQSLVKFTNLYNPHKEARRAFG